MTNESIAEALIRSNRMLQEGQTNPRLRGVLVSEFGSLDGVFVIDWIPEQGEDLYTVAVPPGIIATVEIPRGACDEAIASIATTPIDQYILNKQQTSKLIRRRLSLIRKIWG